MKQPPLITPREVDVPRAQRHTLPNGASLYAIPADDFEVLRFTFVFRAGSSMQHTPFAASATANMLSEGSRDMTARQIAERLDFHGSYFEVNVDRDYVYISFSSLSKFSLRPSKSRNKSSCNRFSRRTNCVPIAKTQAGPHDRTAQGRYRRA